MLRTIIAVVIAALGAVLLAGGVWLLFLGGSPAYAVIGAALLIAAALLFQNRKEGFAVYAVTVLAALIWSVWEVGLDWWPLAARGGLLIVLGALLLLPAVWRPARTDLPGNRPPVRTAPLGLAISLVIAVAVGVYAMFQDPHDTAGAFPAEQMNATATVKTDGVADGDWSAYGRTTYGQRYSPLAQITPANISGLTEAWRFTTGEIRSSADPTETTYEVTPLVVDGTMYICTPFSTVIALDPVSGKEKWRFDPQLKQPPTQTTQHMTCRGVSYHDGTGAQPATTAATVLATLDAQAALEQSAAEVTTTAAGVPQNIVTGNAKAGDANPQVTREPVTAAGVASPDCIRRLFVPTSDGRLIAISAATGAVCPGFGGSDGTVNLWANMPNITPGSAYSTSPPVVTSKVVIVGGAVNDNASATSPSGVIRAFDVNTGALVWNFDSKRPDDTAPIADDKTYSENAPNSWSVASYDPDLNMVYLPMGNQSPDQYGADRSPAVEKYSSSVVALDADTGQTRWVFQTVHHDLWDMDVPSQPSLLDLTVNGQTVPALVQPTKQGEVFVLDRRTGKPILPVTEVAAPTGAVPGDTTAPTQPVSAISFDPPALRESDMWGATIIDQMMCRIAFRQHDYDGRYTPPTEKGSIVYPGNFGTFNWGAVAVDPERQVMFAMPVYLAFTSQQVKRPDATTRVISNPEDPVFNEAFGAPYAARMDAFRSRLGLPCQAPPWGYVAGVDLRSGKTVYQHINGTVRDLSPLQLPFEMGVPGIGGPIITKGGLAFLSGALDNYVRGYDLQTGAEIWRQRLPAGGQATPSTYLGSDGRQYLVVVAGGHGSTGTKAGDYIIAYALPNG